MNKKYYFAIIPFVLGVICFAAYNIIGSTVASDGTLIEAFGFIPLGFLFIVVGIITAFLISTWALFHNPLKFDTLIFYFSLGFIILVSLYLFASMSYLSERARIEISQPVTSQ